MTKKKNLRVVGLKIIYGMIFGVSLLFMANFIPYYETRLGSVVAEGQGPRLYLAGIHIHHYIIGLGLIILSLILTYKKWRYSPYVLGVGIVLFLDQVPNLIWYGFGK